MEDAADTKTSADYYADSYAHFGERLRCGMRRRRELHAEAARAHPSLLPGIHEEMLKDDVRTKMYQRAIYDVRAERAQRTAAAGTHP